MGDYNQLYLSGVNIIDNEGRYGAGVVIAAHAKAVIDSCVIAGNRLAGEMKASERQILGGGVYCAGELELCGTTNLTGNRAQDAQNHLWLDETGTVTIGALGLDKQARVGVSGQAEQALSLIHIYVDAVYNIIEHIDELRDHRRDRQPEQESADRLRAEKRVFLIHPDAFFL